MVSLNPNIAAELKMISTNFPDIEQGVLVYRVMIGSPAYKSVFVSLSNSKYFIMVALCNRADHHIFILFLLSSSFFFFFPRLISAVGDWMFTILWHMVWP